MFCVYASCLFSATLVCVYLVLFDFGWLTLISFAGVRFGVVCS